MWGFTPYLHNLCAYYDLLAFLRNYSTTQRRRGAQSPRGSVDTAYGVVQRREVYKQARARADRHGLNIPEDTNMDGETADEADV